MCESFFAKIYVSNTTWWYIIPAETIATKGVNLKLCALIKMNCFIFSLTLSGSTALSRNYLHVSNNLRATTTITTNRPNSRHFCFQPKSIFQFYFTAAAAAVAAVAFTQNFGTICCERFYFSIIKLFGLLPLQWFSGLVWFCSFKQIK